MQNARAQIYAANVARARIVYNKKKDTYLIKVAFNVCETNEKGTWRFPVKCDFVSGDFPYETFESDKARIIAQARAQLRTDHIEFV